MKQENNPTQQKNTSPDKAPPTRARGSPLWQGSRAQAPQQSASLSALTGEGLAALLAGQMPLRDLPNAMLRELTVLLGNEGVNQLLASATNPVHLLPFQLPARVALPAEKQIEAQAPVLTVPPLLSGEGEVCAAFPLADLWDRGEGMPSAGTDRSVGPVEVVL